MALVYCYLNVWPRLSRPGDVCEWELVFTFICCLAWAAELQPARCYTVQASQMKVRILNSYTLQNKSHPILWVAIHISVLKGDAPALSLIVTADSVGNNHTHTHIVWHFAPPHLKLCNFVNDSLLSCLKSTFLQDGLREGKPVFRSVSGEASCGFDGCVWPSVNPDDWLQILHTQVRKLLPTHLSGQYIP